jgi:formate dehydrogenase major subunit
MCITFTEEPKTEMPADEIEIIEGEEEGVIFKNLTNPIEIITDDEWPCKRRFASDYGAGRTGCFRQKSANSPFEGKTETLPVDMVLLAIGQAVEESSH